MCYTEFAVFTHQDEAGVVSVPPAEGRHADFWVLVVMENLTSAVGVSTQDEAGLKPPQQLRRGKNTSALRDRLPLAYIISFITITITIIIIICCFDMGTFFSDSRQLYCILIG